MTSGCGCGCAATGGGICPCEDVHGPWWPQNPSGLPQLAYRVGDFSSFRQELTRHLHGEQVLTAWRPSAGGDLALQVIDWFSIVADVLGFYSERIANEAYLGTAVLPESVEGLVSILGYRPRPGIGALATLAVIAARQAAVVIPDRFAIASKAQPGIDSQIFELTRGTRFAAPTSVPSAPPDDLHTAPTAGGPPPGSAPGAAEPPAHEQLLARGGVLVKGKPTSVLVGDRLLLAANLWQSADESAAIVTVRGMALENDPHGRPNTRVVLDGAASLPADAKAADYRLARPTRTSHLVTVPSGEQSLAGDTAYLEATARWLKPGDALLFSAPAAGSALAQLSSYSETVWFANGDSSTPPGPPSGGPPPIPLIVSRLEVSVQSGPDLHSRYAGHASSVTVQSGWVDVGTLLDTPVTRLSAVPSTLTLAQPPTAPAGVATPALLEDSTGAGGAITATATAGSSDVAVAGDGGAAVLAPPLRLLWDLITVTRGASVRGEQLGIGDATLAGQDFKLSRSPVTYLADGSPGTHGRSRSGDGYSSTIELIVDGVIWTEVPMLYGHGPEELIFNSYEDAGGYTHVVTGDGETGARLRTGAAVCANYRTGSGAATPPAGSLTQILSPAFNVSAVRNPVPAGAGADPDPPSQLRRFAPRSVLTFGRAVSGDDYEAVAALAPGVMRAQAVWSWDAAEQRALVIVYVGDDEAAVGAAREALREQADPNRPIVVRAAHALDASLEITLRIDPAHVADDVIDAVRATLDGLFAPGVLGIGQVLYRSRIEAACQVAGVLAVHQLQLSGSCGPRFAPGEGRFMRLTELTVSAVQS